MLSFLHSIHIHLSKTLLNKNKNSYLKLAGEIHKILTSNRVIFLPIIKFIHLYKVDSHCVEKYIQLIS